MSEFYSFVIIISLGINIFLICEPYDKHGVMVFPVCHIHIRYVPILYIL